MDSKHEMLMAISPELQLFEKLFTDYLNPAVNTIAESEPYLKAVTEISKKVRQARFASFMKQYIDQVSKVPNDVERMEKVTRLTSLMKKRHNLEFVMETLRTAIDGRSIYSSSLLGCMAGLVINKEIDISIVELTIIQALKNINDFELRMIVEFYDRDEKQTIEKKRTTAEGTISMERIFAPRKVNSNYLIMHAFRTAITTNLFQFVVRHDTLYFTDVSKHFKMLLSVSGVAEQIKNDISQSEIGL